MTEPNYALVVLPLLGLVWAFALALPGVAGAHPLPGQSLPRPCLSGRRRTHLYL